MVGIEPLIPLSPPDAAVDMPAAPVRPVEAARPFTAAAAAASMPPPPDVLLLLLVLGTAVPPPKALPVSLSACCSLGPCWLPWLLTSLMATPPVGATTNSVPSAKPTRTRLPLASSRGQASTQVALPGILAASWVLKAACSPTSNAFGSAISATRAYTQRRSRSLLLGRCYCSHLRGHTHMLVSYHQQSRCTRTALFHGSGVYKSDLNAQNDAASRSRITIC
mmetsp:Transcript_13637/g.41213  ORF Transcript_13637/g.41213 Transcript_13637/m.41213 type:complete len:222 (+) Transcript_13637:3358-4023(+)